MDFKDKDWQVNRTMDQLERLAKSIDRCLNCGVENLVVDADNDMIVCCQCGATWESLESYLDEKAHIMTKTDLLAEEVSHNTNKEGS